MMQSFHQSAETFEILLNKAKYDALSDNLKTIVRGAVEACSADMSWKAHRPLLAGLHRHADRRTTCKVYKTPDAVLEAQLKIWDEVIAKKSADEIPGSRRCSNSQKAFARALRQLEIRPGGRLPHGLQPLFPRLAGDRHTLGPPRECRGGLSSA